MPVRNQRVLSGGVSLSEGDYLGGEYGIKIDEVPEDFYRDFHDRVKEKLSPENPSTEELVRFSTEAVDDIVDHTYDLAQEYGIEDWRELDRERIEAQRKGGDIQISNVCNGEWGGRVAGKCRERAALLQMGLDSIEERYDLDIEPSYREGIVGYEEKREGHAWVGLRIDGKRFVADPDFAYDEGFESVQRLVGAEPSYAERGIEGRFGSDY